jgi:hypothetical protein
MEVVPAAEDGPDVPMGPVADAVAPPAIADAVAIFACDTTVMPALSIFVYQIQNSLQKTTPISGSMMSMRVYTRMNRVGSLCNRSTGSMPYRRGGYRGGYRNRGVIIGSHHYTRGRPNLKIPGMQECIKAVGNSAEQLEAAINREAEACTALFRSILHHEQIQGISKDSTVSNVAKDGILVKQNGSSPTTVNITDIISAVKQLPEEECNSEIDCVCIYKTKNHPDSDSISVYKYGFKFTANDENQKEMDVFMGTCKKDDYMAIFSNEFSERINQTTQQVSMVCVNTISRTIRCIGENDSDEVIKFNRDTDFFKTWHMKLYMQMCTDSVNELESWSSLPTKKGLCIHMYQVKLRNGSSDLLIAMSHPKIKIRNTKAAASISDTAAGLTGTPITTASKPNSKAPVASMTITQSAADGPARLAASKPVAAAAPVRSAYRGVMQVH